MGLLDDFLTGYRGATGTANQALGEYFEDYKTWASRNKEMLPEVINKFGESLNQVANLPGADMVVPMPPVGALWSKTKPMLETIAQIRDKPIPTKHMELLQRLTEEFPQVTNAGLELGYKTSWGPPKYNIYPVGGWDMASNTGTIFLNRNATSTAPPGLSYGHEAVHAITGPMWEWLPQKFPTEPIHDVVQPVRAGMEGLAEGFSHGMLGLFNKQAEQGYWRRPYMGKTFNSLSPAHPASQAYVLGGDLGVDMGEHFARGGAIKPLEPTEALYNLLLRMGD